MVGSQAFVLPEVVEAVAGLDAEVVLTANPADVAKLGELPPGVRVLEHCPVHLLLPSCDAVIHHGGAGTTMTATVAGVPQLALPCAMDQFLNSRRVAASGIGIDLPAHAVDAASVRDAVRRLLDEPGYRTAAARLRDETLMLPTPLHVAGELADLTVPATRR
jgi:UDP:flavonoid glycosyltransferase YjiC (YdhE family)